MYSAHNEGKSVVAERFIRTLKNKIYKHMAAISKNVCFNVLNDIVDKYNNTCHKTIKMKPIDVKSDSYDDLPLNKILCFSVLNILCESVFQTKNKCYPQIHINECEYECEY